MAFHKIVNFLNRLFRVRRLENIIWEKIVMIVGGHEYLQLAFDWEPNGVLIFTRENSLEETEICLYAEEIQTKTDS